MAKANMISNKTNMELKRTHLTTHAKYKTFGNRSLRWEVMYWIHLAKDRGQSRVPVNTIMNRRVP